MCDFTILLLVIMCLPLNSFAQKDPIVEAKIQQRDLQLLSDINNRLGKLDKSDPAYKTKLELAEKLNREQKAKVDAQNVADRLAAKKANPQLYPNLRQGVQRNEQGVQYGQLPADADRKQAQYEQLSQNGNQNQGQNRALLGNQENGQNKTQGANQQSPYIPISAPKEKVPPALLKGNPQQDPNKQVKFTEQQSRIIAEGRQDLKDIEKNRQGKFQDEVSSSNKLLAKKQATERELLQSKQNNQRDQLLQKQDNKEFQKLQKVDNERMKAIAKSRDGQLTPEQKTVFALKEAKIKADMKKETNKKLAAQAKVNARPKQELLKRQQAEAKKHIKSNQTKTNKINSSAKKEAKPIKKKITKTVKSATKATKKVAKKGTKKTTPRKKSKK